MRNAPDFCDTGFGVRNSNAGINGGMIETTCAPLNIPIVL